MECTEDHKLVISHNCSQRKMETHKKEVELALKNRSSFGFGNYKICK